MHRRPVALASAFLSFSLLAQQAPPSSDTRELFARAQAATVLILAGEGAGRLRSLGTGVVVGKDGVILTALHVVKGAAELQIRTSSGEAYDRVEMIGSDERRDIAALKVTASNLPTLPEGSSSAMTMGDPVYAVTNANGLTWSATQGILSATRPADEIAGAGSGYRVLQFTAPVAPGSSGGALVDRSGTLVGIITSAKNNAAFAIPIESVAGLTTAGDHLRFGSGALLQLPAQVEAAAPKSSEALRDSNPKQMLQQAKTVYIHSKTMFFTVDTLDHALAENKNWQKMGLQIVQDLRLADLTIELDRPLFTYVHTFVLSDKRTTIVLGSGKVTALDGNIASGDVAKQITAILQKARDSAAAK